MLSGPVRADREAKFMTEQLQKDIVDIMFARAKFLEILNLGQTVAGTNGLGKNLLHPEKYHHK